MSRTTYPRLWHLFGAFFHQDWCLEADSWPDVIRNFAQGEKAGELEAVAADLDRLLLDFPDDDGLDHELYYVLGCECVPCTNLGDPSVRVWLGQVSEYLRQLAKDR